MHSLLGKKLTLACLIQPNTLTCCVKWQLAHDHPMSQCFEEDYVDLASRMTLFVDGDVELDDNKPIGNYMIVGTSTENPYPNEITIRVEGKEPPTLNTKQRQRLLKECKNADFMIGERKLCPVFPGVIEVPDTRHNMCHGFPILVMLGDKKTYEGRSGLPLPSVLQGPTTTSTKCM